MNKKVVTAGLLAGLVAGSGAGFIMSNSTFVGASNYPAVVVEEDGTTSTDETAEPGSRIAEVLAPLVEDGTLTQTQADAVVQAMVDAAPLGGRGGRGGGGMHRGERGESLAVVAEAIGIEEDALREALHDGSTIADVAAINNVPIDDVIDAVVADREADIAQHVADGDITQEQADARLADLESRVTDMVNGIRPERPARGADTETDDTTTDDSDTSTTTG